MKRSHLLIGVATTALVLSFTAVDAKAIFLPDNTSPCGGGNGGDPNACLTITNLISGNGGGPHLGVRSPAIAL